MVTGPGLVDFCFCSWWCVRFSDFGQPSSGIWCCVRRTHTYTLHKHTGVRTHTLSQRRQQSVAAGQAAALIRSYAHLLTFSLAAPSSDDVPLCVCVCECVSVVGEFSSHGSLLPCFLLFCFASPRPKRREPFAVCYFSRRRRPFSGLRDQPPQLSCVFFRSLALSWGVFPLALARTHAHTVTCTHNFIYGQRMMLSWVPRIFLLASSFCTALWNFSLVVCGFLALFFPELQMCQKLSKYQLFFYTRERLLGGFFKSLRLWMLHLHF